MKPWERYNLHHPDRVRASNRKYQTPERIAWRNMHRRCKDAGNKNYGGRGIQVCARWGGRNGFKNFLADMGLRPTLKHSLDRKRNWSNYTPRNCRWATKLEQEANTRKNRVIEFRGKKQHAAAWARQLGMTPQKLSTRLNRLGWSIEEALR